LRKIGDNKQITMRHDSVGKQMIKQLKENKEEKKREEEGEDEVALN